MLDVSSLMCLGRLAERSCHLECLAVRHLGGQVDISRRRTRRIEWTVVPVDEHAQRYLRALASADRRSCNPVVGVEQDLDVRPVLAAVIRDGQDVPVQLERLFRPVQGASQAIPVPVARLARTGGGQRSRQAGRQTQACQRQPTAARSQAPIVSMCPLGCRFHDVPPFRRRSDVSAGDFERLLPHFRRSVPGTAVLSAC
jgi:hypothetical protein